MSADGIKEEAISLLKSGLSHVKPTPEDQAKIAAYTLGYSEALIAGDKDKAQGYMDALTITLGRYSLKAEEAREQFVYDAIFAAARIGVMALV